MGEYEHVIIAAITVSTVRPFMMELSGSVNLRCALPTGLPSVHGPIEVLDEEIVPWGALDEASPHGARVYEATGNEGASLELQYRSAVLVFWRRNRATLKMLARCGGRPAIAVEYTRRNWRKTARSEAYRPPPPPPESS